MVIYTDFLNLQEFKNDSRIYRQAPLKVDERVTLSVIPEGENQKSHITKLAENRSQYVITRVLKGVVTK